jgi:beta-lactamase class A
MTRNPLLFASLLAIALVLSLRGRGAEPAMAQSPAITPQEALARLFSAGQVDPAWFSPDFLQVVSADQVQSLVEGLKASLGPFVDVEPAGSGFTVVFERGTVPAAIALDASGQIIGLRFQPPQPRSLQDVLSRFQALPGQVSVLILKDGQDLTAMNADTPLAVGSAFKLAPLTALRHQIDAGQRSWSDVVALDPAWKSLPSGMLQSWPDGSPLTLDTLASLMISISDNTAADAAINVAGRGAVEQYGSRNVPFLTTRELFTLKDPTNVDLLDRWRAGDVAARRRVLVEADARPLPRVTLFSDSGGVLAPDVEWFFSARELCGLMAGVQDLPLMSINPGVASPADWARIAYKGGAEPGMLNLTTWLESKDGHTYCVATTWNDNKPLDERTFELLVAGTISALAAGGGQ